MIPDLMRLLRPPHPLDNGGADADLAYRTQLYETRVREWRWRMNHTLLGVVCFCLMLLWALSPAGVPMLGSIAWANGTDEKIKTAVAPIQSKVDEIAAQTKAIKDRQVAKDLSDLRQKLFETRVAQCRARGKGEVKDNPYTIRMGELQDLHWALTQTYYLAAACEDL